MDIFGVPIHNPDDQIKLLFMPGGKRTEYYEGNYMFHPSWVITNTGVFPDQLRVSFNIPMRICDADLWHTKSRGYYYIRLEELEQFWSKLATLHNNKHFLRKKPVLKVLEEVKQAGYWVPDDIPQYLTTLSIGITIDDIKTKAYTNRDYTLALKLVEYYLETRYYSCEINALDWLCNTFVYAEEQGINDVDYQSYLNKLHRLSDIEIFDPECDGLLQLAVNTPSITSMELFHVHQYKDAKRVTDCILRGKYIVEVEDNIYYETCKNLNGDLTMGNKFHNSWHLMLKKSAESIGWRENVG